ncbi:hypothetical protein [Roseimicrobium sp. ORNL1]|uniref:hypothetical protein n=1 Tax=Roseimicrobium sp. ORNL1 TaxID=2711231 RepID=UPI0013E2063C|nr:hypothetical protein [Roseimicrobium sp. ORNL1]QIF04803.1 hypothetical protein G5S37_25905 [Roseimicrobium sp. ORNL1]
MRVFTPAVFSLTCVIRALVATFLALAAPLVVDFIFIVGVGWRLAVGVNEPLAHGVPIWSVLFFGYAWPSQSRRHEGNGRKRTQRTQKFLPVEKLFNNARWQASSSAHVRQLRKPYFG